MSSPAEERSRFGEGPLFLFAGSKSCITVIINRRRTFGERTALEESRGFLHGWNRVISSSACTTYLPRTRSFASSDLNAPFSEAKVIQTLWRELGKEFLREESWIGYSVSERCLIELA